MITRLSGTLSFVQPFAVDKNLILHVTRLSPAASQLTVILAAAYFMADYRDEETKTQRGGAAEC